MQMKNMAIVMASALCCGCAVSASNNKPDMSGDDIEMADRFMQTAQAFVQSAVGGAGNVQVILEGDQAILIGYVDSIATRQKAEQAALKDQRVDSVNNRIIAN